MATWKWLDDAISKLFRMPDQGSSPERYRVIRRNMIILITVVTLLPLFIMAFMNYVQFQGVLRQEVLTPMRVLVNKTRNSFELWLAERESTVSFIASDYSFEELSNEKRLNSLFRVLRQEFTGFVDLGLIDSKGNQVSYTGPYNLRGKNYSDQSWYQQVRVERKYISDVFMGYRKFPHVVIAVQRCTDSGEWWVVRATIDTSRFDKLIASMGLDAQSDAFLINREGILQTRSKFYGDVLEKFPLPVPMRSYEPTVIESVDPQGRDVVIAYSYFLRPDFILILVKPKMGVLKAWSALRGDLLVVLLISVAVILGAVFVLVDRLVKRMRESDEKREMAFREVEHSHKLSSIGRLAAGVAHEINNPLAIIGEKAGLFKDLMALNPNFPDKEKFGSLVDSIERSVDRCRTITHRLLGFARRMEVQIEVLDLNSVIQETAGFLEKEALYKNVELRMVLAKDLPSIDSDRGQLQQVFLNILNNAFAAVDEGGQVHVTTFMKDPDTLGVTIQDNGTGMPEETIKHIFDPFFTTKKTKGTGLGLSITYGIVKKLGGEIEVQSKPAVGSRFTVYLPRAPREQQGN
jgi:two-component system, NtrC family, sensor kinase